MRRFLVFVFLSILLTGGFIPAVTVTPLAYGQNGTHYSYIPFVLNNYCRDPVILAVGDSITEGVYTTNPPETAYPRLLELKLEQTYHRNFVSINAAVGGVYSDYFLYPAHYIGDLIDTHQPDLVLLMIGTNDFGSTVSFDWTESNIRTTITTALNKGVRFILASNSPPNPDWRPYQSQRTADFVPRYPTIASDYQIPLARVYSAFLNYPGWEYRLIYLEYNDGLHPNDLGHTVIRDVFFDQVVPMLDQRGCFR